MTDLKARYPVGSVWRWANGELCIVLDHRDPAESFCLVVALQMDSGYGWKIDTLGSALDQVTERVDSSNEPLPSDALSEIAEEHGVDCLIVMTPEQYGLTFCGEYAGELAIVKIVD